MMGLAGYGFMYGLTGTLCAIYDALDGIIGAFGEGLHAIGAVDEVLRRVCGVVATWPVIGWLARAICVAVHELFTATAGIVNGVVLIVGFMIRYAVATTFAVMIAAGMAGAWLLHWALGRDLAYRQCSHRAPRERKARSMSIRFVVLHDDESPAMSRSDADRFEEYTREHLLRECAVEATVSWSE